jgi:hypothetical protein
MQWFLYNIKEIVDLSMRYGLWAGSEDLEL